VASPEALIRAERFPRRKAGWLCVPGQQPQSPNHPDELVDLLWPQHAPRAFDAALSAL